MLSCLDAIEKNNNMKSKIAIILITICSIQVGKAQTIEELYNKRDFQSLIKYAENADELNADDLYCVGYAFFQLEDDLNAIKMYDKAIEKGLDEEQINHYLRKSDEVFLNQALGRKANNTGDSNRTLKIILLVLSLFLLLVVFFGYAKIGLLWLIILWSIIGYSSFR